MFTAPAPQAPVNPAEVPVARAVLDSALLPLHPTSNFDKVYHALRNTYQSLEEEFHHLLSEEVQRRQEEACDTKIIQFIPNH